MNWFSVFTPLFKCCCRNVCCRQRVLKGIIVMLEGKQLKGVMTSYFCRRCKSSVTERILFVYLYRVYHTVFLATDTFCVFNSTATPYVCLQSFVSFLFPEVLFFNTFCIVISLQINCHNFLNLYLFLIYSVM